MPTKPAALLAVAALAVVALAGCGDSASDQSASSSTAAPCPGTPVDVVVSVDQWGDIVDSLGGRCANVTTVLKSSAADPHDYEPTAADIASFDKAELVVVNGVDYDHWASDAAENVDPEPAIVDAGEVTGVKEGENPHLWYGPDFVTEVAEAVTAELSELAPDNAAYYKERAAEWDTAMKPYFALVADLKKSSSGSPYAATESVFDYMAEAIGLKDVTPQGYRTAAANESDPAPGDVAAFESVLEDGNADVLIYNTQTEGSVPEQLRAAAESAEVPIVDVTESVPEGFDSFEGWQVAQLTELQKALATG